MIGTSKQYKDISDRLAKCQDPSELPAFEEEIKFAKVSIMERLALVMSLGLVRQHFDHVSPVVDAEYSLLEEDS